METFFKKYFWVVQAIFVVLLAILAGATVNSIIASYAAPYSVAIPTIESEPIVVSMAQEQPEIELPAPPPPAPAPDPCADVECEEGEECDPATAACFVPEIEDIAEEPSGNGCFESDIAINLVGTMVAVDDELWSVAILHNPATSKTQFATIGTSLLTEAEVTRIERNRIFFTRNGREECLRPGDQSARQQRAAASGTPARPVARERSPARSSARERAASAASVTTAAPTAGTSIEERVRNGVTRGPGGEYQIDRSVIEEVANNRQLLEAQAPRVVPNYVNGQPRGFRLQGIRAGSIFSAIGIRNGDVITEVNGTTIDSPQRALALYEAMLQQENVQMSVLRRGREETLNYAIR
ncbi:MAG: general secretion pathway protein C [Bradymonadia bacterium]|jgi:general secretion pathway protein C